MLNLGFKKAQKNSSMKRRWIEIAIGVDYSVISFHGKHNVEKYVLSLMNIVSIYFVITFLLLLFFFNSINLAN